jgi:hypothetical protein
VSYHPPKKAFPNAARIPCLKCHKNFRSRDKTNNRICQRCGTCSGLGIFFLGFDTSKRFWQNIGLIKHQEPVNG